MEDYEVDSDDEEAAVRGTKSFHVIYERSNLVVLEPTNF